jgi:hypothetical protein
LKILHSAVQQQVVQEEPEAEADVDTDDDHVSNSGVSPSAIGTAVGSDNGRNEAVEDEEVADQASIDELLSADTINNTDNNDTSADTAAAATGGGAVAATAVQYDEANNNNNNNNNEEYAEQYDAAEDTTNQLHDTTNQLDETAMSIPPLDFNAHHVSA